MDIYHTSHSIFSVHAKILIEEVREMLTNNGGGDLNAKLPSLVLYFPFSSNIPGLGMRVPECYHCVVLQQNRAVTTRKRDSSL